ncbi:MAG: GNAT family N-acetyltransferase [Planctomycetota bacterium]
MPSGDPDHSGQGREQHELDVRAMGPADREQVLRIEADSHPDAWTAAALDGWLARPRTSGFMLLRGSECVGFFIVLQARTHLHLVNLAVARAARRSGVGTLALRAIAEVARERGLTRVELDVRETNLAAQLLYQKCGYRAVEIRRRYYGDQDGYRMSKNL